MLNQDCGRVLSYVILSYNHAAFISAAIQSILAQQGNYEMIVVDDGSTDDSLIRIQHLVAGLSHVTVITQPNLGIVAARNRGLACSKGEYICFLDSDDVLADGHLASIRQELSQSPSPSLLYGDAWIIDVNGKQLGKFSDNYPPKVGDFSLMMLGHYCFAPSSGTVYRRTVFERTGPYWGPGHCTDYLKAIEAGLCGEVRRIQGKPLASWRWHTGNNSRGGLLQRAAQNAEINQALCELVDVRWTSQSHVAAKRLVRRGAAMRNLRHAVFCLAEANFQLASEQLALSPKVLVVSRLTQLLVATPLYPVLTFFSKLAIWLLLPVRLSKNRCNPTTSKGPSI